MFGLVVERCSDVRDKPETPSIDVDQGVVRIKPLLDPGGRDLP